MAGTVSTQEGEVPLGARTSDAPAQEVAYPNAAMEKEMADQLAAASSEIFRGPDWGELPNFYCPLDNYATLDGDKAVLNHGADRHPGVDLVAAQEEKVKADKAAAKEAKASAKEEKESGQVKNG